jgi:hypothetical protein
LFALISANRGLKTAARLIAEIALFANCNPAFDPVKQEISEDGPRKLETVNYKRE